MRGFVHEDDADVICIRGSCGQQISTIVIGVAERAKRLLFARQAIAHIVAVDRRARGVVHRRPLAHWRCK